MEEVFNEYGVKLVSGGSDNHLLLIDTKTSFGITGKDSETILSKLGIYVNKNVLPFDKEKPSVTSGIRVGTPAMTTKGFKEEDFREVGKIIALRLKNDETDEIKNECL
jgi:glycine hydroxymethyltransferase